MAGVLNEMIFRFSLTQTIPRVCFSAAQFKPICQVSFWQEKGEHIYSACCVPSSAFCWIFPGVVLGKGRQQGAVEWFPCWIEQRGRGSRSCFPSSLMTFTSTGLSSGSSTPEGLSWAAKAHFSPAQGCLGAFQHCWWSCWYSGIIRISSDHAQLGIKEMYELRRDFPALFILLQGWECCFLDTGEQKFGDDVVSCCRFVGTLSLGAFSAAVAHQISVPISD